MKRPRLGLAVLILLVQAACLSAAAQNPVIEWNAIAITTALNGNQSISPGSSAPGAAEVYIAYVQLAVYNAVNAIDSCYRVALGFGPTHGTRCVRRRQQSGGGLGPLS